MKYWLLPVCLVASPALGQTYATAIAKMDHIYVGESFSATASTTLADEVGATDLTLSGGDNVDAIDTTGPTAWLTSSIELDGTADYLTASSSIGAAAITDLTLFWWSKRGSTAGRDCVWGDSTDATLDFIRFEANNTEIDVSFGQPVSTVNPGVTTTDWHSYAIVRDSSDGSTSLYVDGSYVGDFTADNGDMPTDQIGAKGSSQGDLYLGLLAGIMTADEELSAAEIAALHAGPSSGPATNPISDSIPGSAVNPIRTTIP